MKRTLLLFSLFFCISLVFSQELITPIKSESFGLNNHTNRDISYFSHLDSNKNTLIIGTTEKDSTFTDIVTIKLDQNLNSLWEKNISINTDLSYDIPLKSFINSDDELIIIGRSSFRQSTGNGLIFILKYDENGTLLFNETIGNIDGSDYTDFAYFDAGLNVDGTLSLVYSPSNWESDEFNFLKFSSTGDIISSYTIDIPNEGLIGITKNETFYLFVRELIDEINFNYRFKLYRIQGENNVNITEITDNTFLDYYRNISLSEDVQLNLDSRGNCYFVCQNNSNNDTEDQINITRFDSSNTMSYSINTLDTDDYSLVSSFVNKQDEITVISNNNDTNVIDFIGVDVSNNLQITSNSGNYLGTGFKKNSDDSFFVTTSNSNVRLFSDEFNELKSFNTSDSYELIDFLKLDESSISTIGTSYDKMFPESDFFTKLDIQAEKLNESQIVNNYSFSGLGTSRAFQQRIIIDNENNYLVLVTEKMGPEYLGIGGADPPLNNRIVKFDSNLNKLWESEVPDHIFNVVTNGGRDIDFFIDASNNLYLNLPRPGNTYGLGYDLYKVDPNGNFEFISEAYIADKFLGTDDRIFMARDYFTYDDSSKFYVLDKNTGDVLQEINVDHEEFLHVFTIGSDYYFYTYKSESNNTPDFLYLYKNGVKVFTRNLDNNYGIYINQIDENGTLFFATDYGATRKIHKVDIDNSYSSVYVHEDVLRLKLYNNGNIFLYFDDDSTKILDNDLNTITFGESISSFNPYLRPWNDVMLFGTAFEQSVRIIDADGIVIDYFLTEGSLHDWYSDFDHNGDLVMVGQFGNIITLNNHYGWFRGFIHKYGSLSALLNVDELNNDKPSDIITFYPNPTSERITVNIDNEEINSILLYDLSGKKLKEVHQKNSMDLSRFTSGMYLVKVITKSNKTLHSKVLKN